MQYQEINEIVSKTEEGLTAAEVHGMGTGMLCVNDRTEVEFWLQEVLQDETIDSEDRTLLENLFLLTHKLLSSDAFDFELLLPSDDVPLTVLVEALRKWCQGFLYGLGTASPNSDWPADIREIIKDIAECTKLEVDSEDDEAENDFMEITEYVRTAVIFLHTELNSSQNNTIH